MTIECAIKELKEDIDLYIPLHGTIDDVDRELPDGRLITALEMAIASLEAWDKVRAEIEDYMERKWEQLSDSDKVIVTGITTIDDWKFHMAESTLDIIDRHLQEIKNG